MNTFANGLVADALTLKQLDRSDFCGSLRMVILFSRMTSDEMRKHALLPTGNGRMSAWDIFGAGSASGVLQNGDSLDGRLGLAARNTPDLAKKYRERNLSRQILARNSSRLIHHVCVCL